MSAEKLSYLSLDRDGMDNRTDSGEASFLIPTSFTICIDMYWTTGRIQGRLHFSSRRLLLYVMICTQMAWVYFVTRT